MIVVSDTSPVLNLWATHQLDLLRLLYEEVFIPPGVERELQRNGVDCIGYKWLTVRTPAATPLLTQLNGRLHAGEAEAIALAIELHAERILMDERKGRRIAAEFQVQAVGLLGVLAEAKQRGYLRECKPVLEEMIRVAGFWIGGRLYARFLEEMGEA